MNKTVNINLGGLLFHIDEEAFNRLQQYLDSLKRSFANEPGAEEIIADIEARIAELFNEAKLTELQVINLKNVEDAIAIMGTPEELNDDDSKEEKAPQPEASSSYKPTKKLFRDTSNAYVSGVSAGLGHYFEVDAVWIRIAWLFAVFFSGGTFFLIYISLWIFVPEAKTTAEQLAMKGKSANVNNIEEKIKEGINNVSDSVKTAYNSDNSVKFRNKSAVLFSKLEVLLKRLFSVFGVLIGFFVMFISSVGIVALIFAYLGSGVAGLVYPDWVNMHYFSFSSLPHWLSSIIIFVISVVPLLFFFLLGRRIAFGKAKKVNKSIKLSLLGVWILAILSLTALQFINKKKKAYTATANISETLPFTASDTLGLKMFKNERFVDDFDFDSGYTIRENTNGEKVLVFQDLKIYIATTKSETPTIQIQKKAKGSNYNKALKIAEKIDYKYQINENELILNAFAISDYKDQFVDQKVKVILTLSENMVLYADRSTKAYNNRRNSDDYVTIKNKEHHYLQLTADKVTCLDCSEAENADQDDDDININLDWDFDDENFDEKLEDRIENFVRDRIEENGGSFESGDKDIDIEINENGIKIKTTDRE